jgi:hypothetical protein
MSWSLQLLLPRHFASGTLEGRVIRRIAHSTGKAPLLFLVGRGSWLLLSLWFYFIVLFILGFLRAGLNSMTHFLIVRENRALTEGAPAVGGSPPG